MDKLKKLFDMSEKIILAYADLMFFNEDICDNDIQSDIIDNIRDLVIEEYNLMQKITMERLILFSVIKFWNSKTGFLKSMLFFICILGCSTFLLSLQSVQACKKWVLFSVKVYLI